MTKTGGYGGVGRVGGVAYRRSIALCVQALLIARCWHMFNTNSVLYKHATTAQVPGQLVTTAENGERSSELPWVT